MIRAFISTWSGVAGGDIVAPHEAFLENRTEPDIMVWLHWPDQNMDGLPDKDRVLLIVRGPAVIEQLGDIPGIKMLPAYRFDKPISEIPQNVQDAVKNAIVAEGIPLSALSGVQVYGDFVKKVAKYFAVNHKGFGQYESALAGEWA